jgi:predicted nucleic acid-binding protein
MLIDTNVILDFALNRPPDPLTARDLIHQIETTTANSFIAWHSVATIHYIVQREINRIAARAIVERIIGFLTVAPTSHESLAYALSLPMTDFEDAMQVAAARSCGAEHIVTNNIRDFANSPIPAITPEQALHQLF